jgi:hypothetical protein
MRRMKGSLTDILAVQESIGVVNIISGQPILVSDALASISFNGSIRLDAGWGRTTGAHGSGNRRVRNANWRVDPYPSMSMRIKKYKRIHC